MKQINTTPIVLASQSPRRQELLAQAGLTFDIRAADIDEAALPYNGNPGQYAGTLSRLKADTVAQLHTDTWILGADTIVVADGRILGKPRDRAEAVAMLETLSNRTHSVFTGFTVMNPTQKVTLSEAVETSVTFKALTAHEIGWYADTEEPYDKAGAYGIQGIGAFLVREIRGSYTNVVGLPVCELLATLARLNLIAY